MSIIANVNVRFEYKGRKTTCEILNINREPIAKAFVKRAVDDIDDKRLGRKKAFKKAMNLSSSILSKQERTAIWNQFRETVKQPQK